MKSNKIKLFFVATFFLLLSSQEITQPVPAPESHANHLSDLPMEFSDPHKINGRLTNIDLALQKSLNQFIESRANPIASIVVADIATGNIIAMAQGRSPKEWNSATHTALFSGTPAASLFKAVIATSVLDLTNIDETENFGLMGGCAQVRPNGIWMKDELQNRRGSMSLMRAYGLSCNAFFAKMAVNLVGVGAIENYARKFGWESDVHFTDFKLPKSSLNTPTVENASSQAVGRFGAGFGNVGLSAVHAAWFQLILSNKGRAKNLRFFQDSPENNSLSDKQIISEDVAMRMLNMGTATVRGGTASFAFKRGKYRKLRNLVSGKTGTLSGNHPKGITTWFIGTMPIDDPKIVVASMTLLEPSKYWHFKAPNLAAEAMWNYYNEHLDKKDIMSVSKSKK